MKASPTLLLCTLFASLTLPLGCGNSRNASSHDGSGPAADGPSGTGGGSAGVDASVDANTLGDVASHDGQVAGDLAQEAGGAGGLDGSAAAPCPSAPPRDGEPCDGSLHCYYEDCAGAGRTVAACAQGGWSVSIGACTTSFCQSGTISTSCPAGTLCVAIASGFPVAQCATNSCGSGPISCACLGSCVGTCSVRGTAADGIVVDCNPSCPPGGCV